MNKQDLFAQIQNGSYEQQIAAVRALAAIPEPDVASYLERLMKEARYHHVRYEAAIALSAHGNPRALRPILDLVNEFLKQTNAASVMGSSRPSMDSRTSRQIFEAIVRFADRSTLNDLLQIFSVAVLRQDIAWAVVQIAGEGAGPLLKDKLTSGGAMLEKHEYVRLTAVEGLRCLGNAFAVSALGEALHSGYGESVQYEAARALGAIGTDPSFAILEELVHSHDPRNRRLGCAGIVRSQHPRTIQVLSSTLSDPALRSGAMSSLLERGLDGEDALARGLQGADKPLRDALLEEIQRRTSNKYEPQLSKILERLVLPVHQRQPDDLTISCLINLKSAYILDYLLDQAVEWIENPGSSLDIKRIHNTYRDIKLVGYQLTPRQQAIIERYGDVVLFQETHTRVISQYERAPLTLYEEENYSHRGLIETETESTENYATLRWTINVEDAASHSPPLDMRRFLQDNPDATQDVNQKRYFDKFIPPPVKKKSRFTNPLFLFVLVIVLVTLCFCCLFAAFTILSAGTLSQV